MPTGLPIRFDATTKLFGAVRAVDELTATAEPGRVTGFLGPNGAGKTTALRMLLGLVRPSSGSATIGGQNYRDLAEPSRTVGAALEAVSFHPGRSARAHLRVLATAAAIPGERVDTVLELVGLAPYATRRIGGYSLGMRQRLGLATALLGDPGVIVLDEPTNGLDPEGIRWMRGLLRSLAAEGRTVLVSSHMLGEVQQVVDDVIILARGRVRYTGQLADLERDGGGRVLADSPNRAGLVAALAAAGLPAEAMRQGVLVGVEDPVLVGQIALDAGLPLSQLSRQKSVLEDSFLALVGEEDAR